MIVPLTFNELLIRESDLGVLFTLEVNIVAI